MPQHAVNNWLPSSINLYFQGLFPVENQTNHNQFVYLASDGVGDIVGAPDKRGFQG